MEKIKKSPSIKTRNKLNNKDKWWVQQQNAGDRGKNKFENRTKEIIECEQWRENGLKKKKKKRPGLQEPLRDYKKISDIHITGVSLREKEKKREKKYLIIAENFQKFRKRN